MATNGQEFDPRFDPAFQRGFPGSGAGPATASGTDSASGPGAVTGRRSAAAVVQQLPTPTSLSETPPPIGAAPPRGSAAPALPPAVPTTPSAVRDDGLSIADDAAEPQRSWANPFLAALAVAAVALVAAGLWMFQAAREPFLGSDANSQADYATLTMMMDLAPLMLVLGAGTAIGIVFHFAIDWQKRRR